MALRTLSNAGRRRFGTWRSRPRGTAWCVARVSGSEDRDQGVARHRPLESPALLGAERPSLLRSTLSSQDTSSGSITPLASSPTVASPRGSSPSTEAREDSGPSHRTWGLGDTRRSFDRSVHLDPSIPACHAVPSGLVSNQVRGSIQRSPRIPRYKCACPTIQDRGSMLAKRGSMHRSPRIPRFKCACHASHARVLRSKCAYPSIQVRVSRLATRVSLIQVRVSFDPSTRVVARSARNAGRTGP
jgi:hypothetical protein